MSRETVENRSRVGGPRAPSVMPASPCPRVLIAMVISGILIVSISMAFSVVLPDPGVPPRPDWPSRRTSRSCRRGSRWISRPHSTRSTHRAMPNSTRSLVALTPSMNFNAVLPRYERADRGSSPDLETGQQRVLHRQLPIRGRSTGHWQISRYEIRNPGRASEVVKVCRCRRTRSQHLRRDGTRGLRNRFTPSR